MLYCNKCSSKLKEPYIFCSTCGWKQTNTIYNLEKSSDNQMEEKDKEISKNIDRSNLIIGEIYESEY